MDGMMRCIDDSDLGRIFPILVHIRREILEIDIQFGIPHDHTVVGIPFGISLETIPRPFMDHIIAEQ